MKSVFLACVLLAAPIAASAQTPPAIEARTAIGASHYLHSDLGYTAPTLLVSLRIGKGSFAVEPEFAVAWHEETQKFGFGTAPVTTTTSASRFQSFGVNLLARSGGRVSGFAGGGLGAYWERYRYSVRAPANSYEQIRTQGPRAGAQLVGGVDVPITNRIKAFGQGRYEMRSFDDPGGGSVLQGFGGIAIAIR